MNHLDFMHLAIDNAKQCKPANPAVTPRVGAVVALGDKVLAQASRGTDDHAEKIALSKVNDTQKLSEATVYTTLEPCTKHVRRGTLDSCTERLIAARVKKVVIGILDPNQGVCGKGCLTLQQSGIEVELFPHGLAVEILRINDEFVRAQQSLGLKITEPKTGTKFEKPGTINVRGTLINAPLPGEEVYAVVQKQGDWWPNQQIRPVTGTNNWECQISVGRAGQYTLHIVKSILFTL